MLGPSTLALRAGVDGNRARLTRRLEAGRPEIELAVIARVQAISSPSEVFDVEYVAGLPLAIRAALDYAILALARGEDRAPPMPLVLLTQVRLAARHGVKLDIVLRRYVAGYSLLTESIIAAADDTGLLGSSTLKRALRGHATLLDRLLAVVSEEYCRELTERPISPARRRLDRVKRLLSGELVDTTELNYDFESAHVGVVGFGAGVADAIRKLATRCDKQLLLVSPEDDRAWAWLGSRHHTESAGRSHVVEVARTGFGNVILAFGEPAEGLHGWRLTHGQAAVAFTTANSEVCSVVRYADVALLASLRQDALLVASLRQLYLEPLEAERDGGAAARDTLRAYFAAGRNITSAAAALGVSRQTVRSRLRAIEELLGRTLDACASELDAVLRLESGSDPLEPPNLLYASDGH